MSKGVETSGARIGPLLVRAYAVERIRIRHVMKALECVQDSALRELWRKRLQLARSRADMLSRMLSRCGSDPAAMPTDADDCLLAAMELARCNGDLAAAEAVARECVALADIQCACAWRALDQALAEAEADSEPLGPRGFSVATASR